MPLVSVPRRWILLTFGLLLLGAFGVRLLTFERYLPVTDYTDENVWFLVGQNWRGATQDEFIAWRYAGIPPVYAIVNSAVQTLVEWAVPTEWTVPPQHFVTLRLLSVLVGTLTTAVIIGAGYWLAGPLAGLMAGMIWAFAPVIVDHNSLALPDPFVYLFSASALTLALGGWQKKSLPWLCASFLAVLLAVYSKGWPAHAMIPWGFALLMLSVRQPKRYLPWLLGGVALFGLAMYYLAFVYGSTANPSREMQTISNDGLAFMLTPWRHEQNWRFAIYPIGLFPFFGVVVAGLVSWLWSSRRGWWTLDWMRIAMLVLFSFAGITLASSFTVARLAAGKIRHVLPVTVALIPLWGALLTQIVSAVTRWSAGRFSGRLRQYALPAALPALLIAVFMPSAMHDILALSHEYSKTAMMQVLWEWSDANVPNDGLILMHPNSALERTWNRGWSGYDGHTPFAWWYEEDPTAYTPAEYLERGIAYFVFDERDLREVFQNIDGFEQYLSALTLVKTIPADETIKGNTVYFYRMAAPQHMAHALFGEQIALAGYDLSTTVVAPGKSLVFRPYWQARHQPDTNYSMFVHVYPADEIRLITQYDGAPGAPQRPTITWDDAQELIIGPSVTLTLPVGTPPGAYVLAIGLYDYTTGARLTLEDGTDYFAISIRVE